MVKIFSVLALLMCFMCSYASAANWTYHWFKTDAKIHRVKVLYAADGSIEYFGMLCGNDSGKAWLQADLTLGDAALNRILSQALTIYASGGDVAAFLKSGKVVGIEAK